VRQPVNNIENVTSMVLGLSVDSSNVMGYHQKKRNEKATKEGYNEHEGSRT
jgi:hypothetical protein